MAVYGSKTAHDVKGVVVRGPREGSIIVFRVDSFEKLMAKATELDRGAPA
jgi:hypothetical protein